MINTGDILQGRYQIIRIIGKGGMSTVYQAKDLIEGRLLALKDIVRNGVEEHAAIEATLVTEGRLLKSLSNRHLPRIYEIIEEPDRFQLVMDFIEGESLDKVIAHQGPQPMDTVLNWGMQICEVLDYLHNQPVPIIYRDMKPANLILQPDGQLMMIDFGTARTQKLGVKMEQDTTCLGTAGFAAPEQYGGYGQSTPRTDIFCLGATLYNMITGHSPSNHPKGILPLECWSPELKDTPLDTIITKCTRGDPNARYQTARELYEDLKKARLGNFTSSRGESGRLSGGRAKAWQKQRVTANLKNEGHSGVLAGLVSIAKNADQEKKQAEAAGWKTSVQIPADVPAAGSMHGQPVPQMQTAAPNQADTWRRIMVIGLIVAVAMLLVGMVMVLASALTVGLVCMIVALGGAALGVIGLIFSKMEEQQSIPGAGG